MSLSDRLAPPSARTASPGSARTGAVATRLEWGATVAMSVALAASPAYVVRFVIGRQLPTNLLEIFLGAAIIVGLLATRGTVPWRNPYTWPALLFLIAATIEVPVAPQLTSALGYWKDFFIEPALAALIIAQLARSRARARLLLSGLAIAGLIGAGVNLVNDASLLMSHQFHVLTPPVVIYDSPNAVPLYLVPLDAIALALLVFSDDRRERAAAGGFVVVTAAAILLSFSRGGWAALAAVVIFVALFTVWRWQVILAVVGVAVVGFVSSAGIRRRVLIELQFNSSHNSASTRVALWRSTLGLLSHHPLTGAGLAGFKRALVPYRVATPRPASTYDAIFPHNIVLNFWVETGLVGLVAFVWLLVQVVRTGIRGLRTDPFTRAISIGVLGVVVAIVVHGMVDVPYFKNDQALAFWAILGLQAGLLAPAAAAPPAQGAAPP